MPMQLTVTGTFKFQNGNVQVHIFGLSMADALWANEQSKDYKIIVDKKSFKMIQELPFAVKWKIAENDLTAMKDSANGCLISTFATTTSGIQYCLQIFPNGNRKENHEKVFVFLVVRIGNFKEVKAQWVIKTESAKHYSRQIDYTFKKSGGWGKRYCDAAELFDVQKGFIQAGKMEMKVTGTFKFEDGDVGIRSMLGCESSIAKALWTNKQSKDYKIIVDEKSFMVHKLVLATMSPVFDKMFKSNSKDDLQNQLTISGFSFHIVKIALKEIYGHNYIISENTNDLELLINFFDKFNIPSLKERFVNQLLYIEGKSDHRKFGGLTILLYDSPFYFYQLICLGDKLWEDNESKDFKIIVDEKAIKVHKIILAAGSPSFAAMFRSTPDKNGFVISNFPFDVVERAMNVLYGGSVCTRCFVDINYATSLLEFFDEYNFPGLKENFETVSMRSIFAKTVCRLTNYAVKTNSSEIKEKCLEFLMSAYASNTPLYGLNNLDKDVALKIIQNSGHRVVDKDTSLKIFQEYLYQTVYTQKEKASSSTMSSSK